VGTGRPEDSFRIALTGLICSAGSPPISTRSSRRPGPATSRRGHQVRTGHQSQDRQGLGPHGPAVAAAEGGSGHRVASRRSCCHAESGVRMDLDRRRCCPRPRIRVGQFLGTWSVSWLWLEEDAWGGHRSFAHRCRTIFEAPPGGISIVAAPGREFAVKIRLSVRMADAHAMGRAPTPQTGIGVAIRIAGMRECPANPSRPSQPTTRRGEIQSHERALPTRLG
jgi:hypothetical protein